MAVAYQTGSATSTTFGNVASVSFNITVGTGTDRLLIVNVSNRHADTSVTGVDFDSAGTPVAMTEVTTCRNPTPLATDIRTTMYRLVNPASGTKQVTVSLSPTDTNLIGVAGGEVFENVHQTTPLGTPVTHVQDADSSTATTTVQTSAGDMVAAAHGITGSHTNYALDTSGGAVELYTQLPGPRGSAAYDAASGSSTTITWTWTTARISAMIGVAVLQSAASVPSPGAGALSLAGVGLRLGFTIHMPDEA